MNSSEVIWPLSRISDALCALAKASGLHSTTARQAIHPCTTAIAHLSDPTLAIDRVAHSLGLDLLHTGAAYHEFLTLMRRAGPALLVLPGQGYLLLLRGGSRRISLLGTNLQPTHRPHAWLQRIVWTEIEAPHRLSIAALLDHAQVRGPRRPRAERLLLEQRLAQVRFDSILLMRVPADADLSMMARAWRLPARLIHLVVAHGLDHLLGLLAFLLLGQGILRGSLERGVVWGSLLLLITSLLLRTLATEREESLFTDVGVLLRQRLLSGTLLLSAARLRSEGLGRMLGRVLESEALERLLSGSALGLLGSSVELAAAALLFLWSRNAPLIAGFAVWLAVCFALAIRMHRRQTDTAAARLALTQQLIESMVGHRTRLVQQPRAAWHESEDIAIETYLDQSTRADRVSAQTLQLTGRGFVLLGLLAILPDFIWAPPDLVTSAQLGISLWGLLLAADAFARLAQGLRQLSGAVVSAQQVAPLLQRDSDSARPARGLSSDSLGPQMPRKLTLHDLALQHSTSGKPLLRGVSLVIHPGDRVLLEGPSGGGKSTLAAVLAGLREVDTGLLLLGGRDIATLGAAEWRKRVALAPQYHENHILTGSLAYNLLLGRTWPPAPADLNEAAALCEELGLGPLLARMPAGLHQLLGETGWQLSQGERSRIYLARALLQGAEVVILDECLAALDPDTLVRVMHCVWHRAPSLVAIVHP